MKKNSRITRVIVIFIASILVFTVSACTAITEDSTSNSVPSGLEQPIEKNTRESLTPEKSPEMLEKAVKIEETIPDFIPEQKAPESELKTEEELVTPVSEEPEVEVTENTPVEILEPKTEEELVTPVIEEPEVEVTENTPVEILEPTETTPEIQAKVIPSVTKELKETETIKTESEIEELETE
ncbi:MAG: hypothetical protein QNJ38_05355 [Prochloraceae cyanobacterium]|nr:hypothetical protein [Prochloraceae cyanobacterium]